MQAGSPSSGISSGSGSPFSADHSSSPYRLEGLGILVFDVSARYTDEEIRSTVCAPRTLSFKDKKELEGMSEGEREMYIATLTRPSGKQRKWEYTLTLPPSSLRFDSHFEGGNLRKAIKVSEFEYHLVLNSDTSTQSHTQWYYFAVSHMHAGQVVKFSITNLTKPESLYKLGMQPLVFSAMKEQREGMGWHRGGNDVMYQANTVMRGDKQGYFRTLSFTYRFECTGDVVYFAHCYPYTFSDLRKYLAVLEITAPARTLRIETLCRTEVGNECPLLTITSHKEDVPIWEPERKSILYRFHPTKPAPTGKKTVLLTSRIHPGESNSSYIIKGVLDFLLSDSREAYLLRKAFVFRVVPMLNPDGVVYGNTRCNLLGYDLNRRWLQPNRLLQPTVHYTKKLVKNVGEIALYCDFHGHSVKKNAFIYGCVDADFRKNTLIRLFPLFLQRVNKLFSYPDCKFQIEKEKEGTGRVVFFREMGVLNSYTLEASFHGPSNANTYTTIEDLAGLGRDFCKTLLALTSPKRFRRHVLEICKDVQGRKDGEDWEVESEGKALSVEAALAVLDAQPLPVGVLSGCREDPAAEVCAKPRIAVAPEAEAPSPIRMRSRPLSGRTATRKSVRPQTCARRPSAEQPFSPDLLQAQVSRIYAMLQFYKDAGCGKLLSYPTSSRPVSRDFSQGRKSWVPQLRVRQTGAQRPQSSGRQRPGKEERPTRGWSRSECF